MHDFSDIAALDRRIGHRPNPLDGLESGILGACALACIVLLTTVGCATKPPPEIRAIASSYRVGPPDQLFVSILPEPVIERSVTVRPDGKISVDLIGDVQASGRTAVEIGEEIERRIGRYKRDARATVYVSLAQSAAVTIFGEVRSPGVFSLQRDTRIAEAIGLRGGTTTFATKSRIRVIRAEGATTTRFRVNLAAIQRGDLSTNILLTGGDIVVCPPNVFARIGYFFQTILFPFTPIISGNALVRAGVAAF